MNPMEYIATAVTLGIIALLAAISPGPDFVVVVKNTLNARRVGLMTAFGVGFGILVHVTYSLLGIGLIISQSILLFSLIKYAGAAYLLYLGIQLLRAKKGEDALKKMAGVEKRGGISSWRALGEGFMTNALNPKATLFFLSIFTQVIHPETPLIVQGMYGVEVALVVGIWFSALALFLTMTPIRSKFSRIQYYLSKVMGGMLIAFGIKLALQSHE